MRSILIRTLSIAGVVAVLVAADAAFGLPIRIVAGNIVINADGGFSPKALPRNFDAPITIHGGGSLSTIDGTLPPILKTITLDFDKHGSLQTVGLPICPRRRLTNTTATQARHTCPDSIVGEGSGKAIVQFPDAKPIPAFAPITIFNGPRKDGNATVFAHAYTTVPAPTTYIVPVTIEKIHDGRYGYRTEAAIPPIANGYGTPVSGSLKIGRKWTYKGQKHSYVNARCADLHLQARGAFAFADGTKLSGTFVFPCSVRK
jgi:hypothetical protein